MSETLRNPAMIARIEAAPVRYLFRFVVAGDRGATPNPTGDGLFRQLLAQMNTLQPAPLFFATLGEFSGPGTRERHDAYARLTAGLSVPNLCLLGNHDMDDPAGWDNFTYNRVE
jgi:hypothetical protein